MSNNIFVYKWTGANTGWDYKLEIFGASTEAFSASPTYINLPPGMINVKNADIKYDNYPLGVLAMPELEMEVNINDLPDNIDPEFFDLLFMPQLTIGLMTPGPATINTGTVFMMSIKYNGNDTNDIVDYRPFMIGLHRADTDVNLPAENLVLSIKAIDVRKVICESFNFKRLTTMWTVNDKSCDCIIEGIWTATNNDNYVFGHSTGSVSFNFQPQKLIFDYINEMGAACGSAITRGLITVWEFDFYNTQTFYRQLYDGTGNTGINITDIDLYFLSSFMMTDGVTPVSGMTVYDDENSLMRRYPNSVWDFLVDYAEDSFSKMVLKSWNGFAFIPIFGALVTDRTITIDNLTDVNDTKIKLFTKKLYTATASLYEALEDDNWEDIGEYTKTNTGTKNGQELAIPIIANNMPSQVYYMPYIKDGFYITSTSSGKCHAFGNSIPHSLNLYYFDKPSIMDISADPQAFRVHEYCDFHLGDGLYASTLPGGALKQWALGTKIGTSTGNEAALKLNIAINELQANNEKSLADSGTSGCKPHQIAQTAINVFGNNKQSALTFTACLESFTQFSPGGDVGFALWGTDTRYIFDSTKLHSRLNLGYSNWYPTSVEIDFDKEEATIETLLRTI